MLSSGGMGKGGLGPGTKFLWLLSGRRNSRTWAFISYFSVRLTGEVPASSFIWTRPSSFSPASDTLRLPRNQGSSWPLLPPGASFCAPCHWPPGPGSNSCLSLHPALPCPSCAVVSSHKAIRNWHQQRNKRSCWKPSPWYRGVMVNIAAALLGC